KLVIQVSLTAPEKVYVRFIDEGIGMPKEVLAKLGQPFYTTKENGTGSGYMISKKIIENHFGELRITSEVNKGTMIEVSLPQELVNQLNKM
ncbi:ATP-binding protein, partial [Escherichia coli]